MRYIGAFCILTVFLFAACKSKKQLPVHDSRTVNETSQKKQELSQKLHLEIIDSDNGRLYEFVGDWLGVPHQLGKCTRSGVDCSCFVRMLYRQVYEIDIPRTSAEMFDQSERIEKRGLKEGDLVFFSIKSSKVSHVGVYLKDGWFAHVSTSKGVMVNNISEPYYTRYYSGAGRY